MFIRAIGISAVFLAVVAHGADSKFFTVDRSKLPIELRQLPLDRLSSGALSLINRDGNVVLPPTIRPATAAAEAAAPVALDPRVGPNTRLGDDPAALPDSQRAQAEPHIVRSPINSDFLVGTFQEGRFTNGGALDCGYSISSDGGTNWTRTLIPKLTQTVGGTFYRATDPVAGVDLNGSVYLNTEVATNSTFSLGAVVISKSTDAGSTFGNPVVIYKPKKRSKIFPDKNWMVINNFTGSPHVGRIVVTFTKFVSNVSPILCTHSDNGGATWSAPVPIHSTATSAQGSQPVFLPDGKLVIVYYNFAAPEHLEAVISPDGGTTFGAPILIANNTPWNEPTIRTGSFLPSAAGARTNGFLYVVWQTLFNGEPRVAFSKSIDGGVTWAAPVAISDNPSGSGVFNPAINVSPDGLRVTAIFYDHRDHPGSNNLVDMYLAQSFDGGLNWQPNIRLSSQTSDASLAPLTDSGYMLGDYLAVAETTNATVPAVPIWVDTRTGNPDPFVTRVDVHP